MDAAPAAEAAPLAAIGWRRRLASLTDRANPILVRIVRQELRSRAFVGVYVVLLVAAVIASIVVASFSGEAAEGQAARGLFGVLAWAWSFAICLVQPITAFRTVSNERNEDTWDLVELTGMRPRRVLAGLFMASAVQAMLYTCALAPFMLMAYLLRGLDLLLIAFALVIVPMAGAAASALAVFCACLGTNKASRALLGGLLAIGLTIIWLMSAEMWFAIEQLQRDVLELLLESHRWMIAGVVLNVWVAFIVALLVLAAALLTFRAANRSTGPRVLWYVLWLDLVVWGLSLARTTSAAEVGAVVAFTGYLGLIWAGWLGLFAITEDYELSPRQARSITDPPRAFRSLTCLFGPGAARGRWCWLALSLLSLVVCATGLLWPHPQALQRSDACKFLIRAWALWCYLVAIFVVGDAVCRRWLAGVFPNPPLRRGFIMLLLAVSNLAPWLTLSLLDMGNSPAMAISLFYGEMTLPDRPELWSGTFKVLSLVGLAATAALMRDGARLAIRTQRVLARADDRNPRGG